MTSAHRVAPNLSRHRSSQPTPETTSSSAPTQPSGTSRSNRGATSLPLDDRRNARIRSMLEMAERRVSAAEFGLRGLGQLLGQRLQDLPNNRNTSNSQPVIFPRDRHGNITPIHKHHDGVDDFVRATHASNNPSTGVSR
jgi:hypothetical protein